MSESRLIDDVLETVLALPLHRALGLRLVDPSDPSAGLAVEAHDGVINPSRVLHGGLHGLLIDVTAFLLVATELPSRASAVTISSSVSIAAAAPAGSMITTTARIDRLGGSTAFLSGRIESDGAIIATAQVVKAIRRPRS